MDEHAKIQAARADAEHWRREAEIRQAFLENERALCEIYQRKAAQWDELDASTERVMARLEADGQVSDTSPNTTEA